MSAAYLNSIQYLLTVGYHATESLNRKMEEYDDYVLNITQKPDPTACAWPKICMSIVFLAITALIEPKFPIADLERTDLPVWQW